MEMIRPSNARELASALLAASSAGRSIALRGSGSKDAMGGPVPDAAVDLRLDRLSGVLQYEPHDLTIQVAAGTPWCELTAALAQQGQMLPLDPSCAATATVGGVVAANCSGPRRRHFGSARDMVIGMTIATLDGNLVQTGGMVVKNVAGLDMQKALTGSFGTLAVIASVNFKLAPLPELSRTFVFAFQTAQDCLAARQKVLTSRLQPAAVDILNPQAAKLTGWDAFLLAVRAGGSEAVLARYARELDGATVLEGEKEGAFWQAVQEFAPLSMDQGVDQSHARSVVRVGHMLAELGDVLDSAHGACVARAGNGVSYLAFDRLDALQTWMAATQAKPWSRVIEWSSAEVRSNAELWAAAGEDFELMKRLKLLFDPQHLLNPGRLYGRL